MSRLLRPPEGFLEPRWYSKSGRFYPRFVTGVFNVLREDEAEALAAGFTPDGEETASPAVEVKAQSAETDPDAKLTTAVMSTPGETL